jgi:formate hydrogenlyase subunit 3/multisubunit Na+/H+ antiporter MnhD subunit
MKTAVLVIALIGVLAALAAAGFFMLRRPGPDQRKDAMAKALALRVALSVTVFLCILIAWALGWIEPRSNPLN